MTGSKTSGQRSGRIGILLEARYRRQAQPAGMIEALKAMAQVEVVEIRSSVDLGQCDLLVARGRSLDVLSLMADAEARGVRTINGSLSVRSVVDKIAMHHRLVEAGIAVPPTWTGSFEALRDQLAAHRGPIVVKPVFGDNCRDVTVLDDGTALRSLRWNEPRAIVQRHLPNDGYDVKLYGVGDDVWAVRKPSPLSVAGGISMLMATNTNHVDLAHRCRDAFGLDLYGVDCIATDAGLVVIEVNDFPNYTGIPGADEHLARFVVSALLEDLAVAS